MGLKAKVLKKPPKAHIYKGYQRAQDTNVLQSFPPALYVDPIPFDAIQKRVTHNTAAGATTTVYTVPSGKIAYISYVFCSFTVSVAATSGSATMHAVIGSENIRFANFSSSLVQGTTCFATSMFPMLVLSSGAVVQLTSSNAALSISGSIHVYEIDSP